MTGIPDLPQIFLQRNLRTVPELYPDALLAAYNQTVTDAGDVGTAKSDALTSDAFERVHQRAKEVIGDSDQALRWMGTPVRALHYATPISLLNSRQGQYAVLSVLGRLEHGLI